MLNNRVPYRWHFGVDPGPCLWLTDPDPDSDSAIFVFDLHDANKKKLKKFFCLLLFEDTFTSFFKDKNSKSTVVTKSRNQCFSYYFCLMTEGAGYGSGTLLNKDAYRGRCCREDCRYEGDAHPHSCWQHRRYWRRQSHWYVCFLISPQSTIFYWFHVAILKNSVQFRFLKNF